MAGSFSQEFMADIAQTIQEATGAPVPLSASTWVLTLYHTTLNDTVTALDTGRMSAGSTDFQIKLTNSTATWSLVADASTTPATWNNKIVVTVTTGDFSVPAESTVKAFALQSSTDTGSGVIYAWGDVSPTQALSTGNTVQFSTGDLVFTLGGGTAT